MLNRIGWATDDAPLTINTKHILPITNTVSDLEGVHVEGGPLVFVIEAEATISILNLYRLLQILNMTSDLEL